MNADVPPDTGPRCAQSLDATRGLLARSCGIDGCHSAGASAQSGLDLVTPNVAARIASASASLSGSCRGRGRLVRADDPSQGLFFDKLTTSPVCGETMPLGAPPLTRADIDCVRVLVLHGASSLDASAASDASTDAAVRDGGQG